MLRSGRIRAIAFLLAALTSAAVFGQPSRSFPNRPDSLKFAAIGDNGTGGRPQYEVARQMENAHATFAFDLVIMLGDNMYGGQTPADFVRKFEQPYASLLKAGVTFQASRGNHDRPEQINYAPYNMNGQRYYTYVRGNVRFFALDSTLMDRPQLAWLDNALGSAREEWKICYFHHPLYSSGGTHGSDEELRAQLEPLFLKYGVDVVLSGHEHFYERIKPQKGIYYFVSGGAGKLRKGDVGKSSLTAKAYDTGYHFMLAELGKAAMIFQTINQEGRVIDSAALPRFSDADKKKMAVSTPTIGPR